MIGEEGLKDKLTQIVEGKMVLVAGYTASIWPSVKKHQQKT